MCVQPSTPKPSKGSCVCLILQALLVPFASNKPEQSQSSSSKQDMTGKRDVSCVMGHITHSLGTHKSTFCYKNTSSLHYLKVSFFFCHSIIYQRQPSRKKQNSPTKGCLYLTSSLCSRDTWGFQVKPAPSCA